VLIKAVLTSIPIYQCSVLLAPKDIIAQIETLLRHFLWKGGKQNEKKLLLVSWEKISKPLLEGGLQIRDLEAQNLALGAKLLWNLISRKTSWSKQALWKKYFTGKRIRCLDNPPRVRKGSPIFTICLRAFVLFSTNLTWIPGNGKHIKLWETLLWIPSQALFKLKAI